MDRSQAEANGAWSPSGRAGAKLISAGLFDLAIGAISCSIASILNINSVIVKLPFVLGGFIGMLGIIRILQGARLEDSLEDGDP